MFEIIQPGLLSTLQDQGRRGMRHLGIPWSGAMVPPWQMLTNALVGNTLSHTIVECFEGGFQARFHHSACLAIAADDKAVITLTYDEATTPCQPFTSYNVSQGTTLTIKSTGALRLAVLAVRGLEAKTQLGSTSTYTKAALGGVDGRALVIGDKLSIASVRSDEQAKAQPDAKLCSSILTIPALTNRILHAVPGPQDHHFSKHGLSVFFTGQFELTRDVDRMGARLQGPAVDHLNTAARDIVSDAILPGSVQVPGNGQPIVLLSDTHTAGGYPKIATVASTDLPALALARPGTLFSFRQVTANEAVQLARDFDVEMQKTLASLHPYPDALDTMSLLAHNLIDGVTDGMTDSSN